MLTMKTLGSTLYDYMKNTSGGYSVNDSSAKSGIKNFGADYTNKRLSFTSAYSGATFDSVRDEIDSNYPVVLIFNENILYKSAHATTMYGYKISVTNQEDVSGTKYYVIVKDPGTSSVPTKILGWSKTNISGYFIINVAN